MLSWSFNVMYILEMQIFHAVQLKESIINATTFINIQIIYGRYCLGIIFRRWLSDPITQVCFLIYDGCKLIMAEKTHWNSFIRSKLTHCYFATSAMTICCSHIWLRRQFVFYFLDGSAAIPTLKHHHYVNIFF